MSKAVYYVQECPTCGRSLRVRVAYLGKQVVCQHCQAQFMAIDPANVQAPPVETPSSLLRRAEQLLEIVDRAKVMSN